ncbi:hypothetical protein Tco_1054906 [Tanacetum coccineum]|uniref:Uncharacterized protein n=1 Tax=Tanacetum coccineum TaxID=301880 RepID=A0ABQ5GZ67_9ASTR
MPIQESSIYSHEQKDLELQERPQLVISTIDSKLPQYQSSLAFGLSVTSHPPIEMHGIAKLSFHLHHCLRHVSDGRLLEGGVGHVLAIDPTLKRRISDIVWTDIIEPEEFEHLWERALIDFNLNSHKWLSDLYGLRMTAWRSQAFLLVDRTWHLIQRLRMIDIEAVWNQWLRLEAVDAPEALDPSDQGYKWSSPSHSLDV